jgi:hypothetical protein
VRAVSDEGARAKSAKWLRGREIGVENFSASFVVNNLQNSARRDLTKAKTPGEVGLF